MEKGVSKMSNGCAHGSQTGEDARKAEDAAIQQSLSRIKHKILVMSGKGGVGKSSLAVHLAAGLSMKGFKVGLMDVDLHGPSIPRLLGLVQQTPLHNQDGVFPLTVTENLKAISIEMLMADKDTPTIWRGPLKIGVIRQFIADVIWGSLDFLVIDSPPGTGDEPLTVAQTIPDAWAIIVTTPQEISLSDVRKSINFCRQVQMPILGLVENMSGYICPHCGQESAIFKKGGGRKTALAMNVPFLGSLPFDTRVMEKGDEGRVYLFDDPSPSFRSAMEGILENLTAALEKGQAPEPIPTGEAKSDRKPKADTDTLKIAIPLAEGRLCNHFGHCEQFALIDLQGKNIIQKVMVTPPPHEPGLLPRWLGEKGVDLIIAGGMGQRAISLFNERGIKVLTGAPQLPPEELVAQYVHQALITGENVCDH
jgi:Mrp family chromosome partitioning ATPase/predicted Fe-Mo cluster-binding NifX family protein